MIESNIGTNGNPFQKQAIKSDVRPPAPAADSDREYTRTSAEVARDSRPAAVIWVRDPSGGMGTPSQSRRRHLWTTCVSIPPGLRPVL